MSLLSVLNRVKNNLLPAIVRNTLLDDVLGSVTDEMAIIEAKIESWAFGGYDVESGSAGVTATSNAVVFTDNPIAQQWSVNDEIVLAGSMEGNSGRFVVTAVNSATQLTVNNTFAVTELGLFIAKVKPRLIHMARGLALFPGGYETDSDLRANVVGLATTIHKQRGSIAGIQNEFNRVTNSTVQVIDPTKPLVALTTAQTIAAGGANVTYSLSIVTGTPISIALSNAGSNGRYFVFSTGVGTLIPARRAINSTTYYTDHTSGVQVHFREDRDNGRIYFRVVNRSGSTKTVTVIVTEAASLITATGVNGGLVDDTLALVGGTATTKSSSGAVTGWVVADLGVKEGWVQVSSMTLAAMSLTVSDLSGTVVSQYGMAGLYALTPTGGWPGGAVNTKFGGLIQTIFRGGIAESGITVYASSRPGWYLGFGYIGTFENDDYTMAYPDDFVVLDVDHRNYRNYSLHDIKIAARDHLVPADTEYVIGFV